VVCRAMGRAREDEEVYMAMGRYIWQLGGIWGDRNLS